MQINGRVLEKALEWQGAAMALATVVSTWGSAPVSRGSHLLIHEDGRFEGAVSGGCVEGDVLQLAAEIIASQAARLKTYGVADADAWEVGLPCGGQIAILVQPVSDAGFPPALFTLLRQAQERGEMVSIATDLATGRSVPGEQAAAFVNMYLPARRLLIVGAVQIAQALSRLALSVGVRPVVIDPRARFLTGERFPGIELDDRWPDEAVAAHRPDASTAIVTLSHDVKIDDPALAAALRSPAGYIAALGSRKSHPARLARLTSLGFSSEATARIEGPAGVDIGAVTAEEIALSIAAGMIARFRDRR
jgi:xanthine dehydrogenase accessory factor